MDAVRLTLRILVLPACLVLFCAAVYVLVAWDDPLENLRSRLEAGAAALQNAAGDPNAALLAEIAEAGSYERAWIVDGIGMIISSSEATEVGTKLDAAWADRLVSAGGATRFEAIEWGNRTMFLAAHRSALTGRWSVVLDETSSLWRTRFAVMLFAFGGAVLAIGLIGVGIHRTLHRTILRPLGGLDEASNAALEGAPVSRESLDRLTTGTPVNGIAEAFWRIASERDEAAAQLKESRALYFSALHLTNEMVWITRFDGTIVEANRGFCEHLGVERSAVVGKPLRAFKSLLPEKPLRSLGERSAREQKVFDRMLFTFTKADGMAMDVVASIQAVPHEGKAAFMVVAAIRRPVTADPETRRGLDKDAAEEMDRDGGKGDDEPSGR
ncbi:MAG: PAS domain-containing protein [Rhodothermales bacterium]